MGKIGLPWYSVDELYGQQLYPLKCDSTKIIYAINIFLVTALSSDYIIPRTSHPESTTPTPPSDKQVQHDAKNLRGDEKTFLSPQLERSHIVVTLRNRRAGLSTGTEATGGPLTVYLCSSSDFKELEALPSLLCRDFHYNVRRQKLRVDQLDDFRFLYEVDPRGCVVLCHSMRKKYRFVPNKPDQLDKLYDRFLSYCQAQFGKLENKYPVTTNHDYTRK